MPQLAICMFNKEEMPRWLGKNHNLKWWFKRAIDPFHATKICQVLWNLIKTPLCLGRLDLIYVVVLQ